MNVFNESISTVQLPPRILDVLDFSHLILDQSYILFWDFYKAFNTLEHNFIFLSLKRFGCDAVRTLCFNANSSIKLKQVSSTRFDLKRDILQGCPISPYFFLLAAQLLVDHIKQSNLVGISIAGREVIISQFADDTTLFLKNSVQVALALGM